MEFYIVLSIFIILSCGNIVFLLLFIHSRKAYNKLLKRSLNRKENPYPIADNFKHTEINPQDNADAQLLINLQHLMRKDKIFLDPELNIQDLAHKLGTNKIVASRIINSYYKKNFPTLLNEYRINEAVRLLMNEGKNYKLEIISEMCGYKSRQVFHSAFKKETGVTPNYFRKVSIEQSDY